MTREVELLKVLELMYFIVMDKEEIKKHILNFRFVLKINRESFTNTSIHRLLDHAHNSRVTVFCIPSYLMPKLWNITKISYNLQQVLTIFSKPHLLPIKTPFTNSNINFVVHFRFSRPFLWWHINMTDEIWQKRSLKYMK